MGQVEESQAREEMAVQSLARLEKETLGDDVQLAEHELTIAGPASPCPC